MTFSRMDRWFLTIDCEKLAKIWSLGISCVSFRNRVVEDMRNLDRMKDEYAGIQIPVSVLK